MSTTNRYYIMKLKEHLLLRQKVNAKYSLRAFARDLEIDSSTLGQIIKGKRTLPQAMARELCKKLKLNPIERTLFLESLLIMSTLDKINITENAERHMLDESYGKVIAEWEHYAVLHLFDIKTFKAEATQISQRLGITPHRADVVLYNLETCGLLKKNKRGELTKAHADIRTTEDVTSVALKNSHLETLEMGKSKLLEIDIDLRDFSSANYALDLKKVPEAKTIIREFRQKMAGLLKEGDKTEIYQLAIQFYPLTQIPEQAKQA